MKFIEQAEEILLTPKSVTQPRTPQTGPYQHYERVLLVLARLASINMLGVCNLYPGRLVSVSSQHVHFDDNRRQGLIDRDAY